MCSADRLSHQHFLQSDYLKEPRLVFPGMHKGDQPCGTVDLWGTGKKVCRIDRQQQDVHAKIAMFSAAQG